ncbi:hypothetical protein K488DRAFT_82820 [Vararia minispora EC-137]|uniref:Uncharacterized protein n=1 Tax=Vararia minispora EC-137 TaxID=1314806 RepID=A0ACB8QWC4_9AGAM|nr:hypothetical protein K488DRAFT_82820 [Vararia minispora EC-137]
MAKATFLQKVLNRPSQTYYDHPTDKHYHSAKQQFARAAKEAKELNTNPARLHQPSTFVHGFVIHSLSPPPDSAHSPSLPSSLAGISASATTDDLVHIPPSPAESDDSILDAFYTPPSSPPTSMHLDARLLSAILPLDKLKHHKRPLSAVHALPSPAADAVIPTPSPSPSPPASSTEDARSLLSTGHPSDSTHSSSSEHAHSKLASTPSPLSSPPSDTPQAYSSPIHIHDHPSAPLVSVASEPILTSTATSEADDLSSIFSHDALSQSTQPTSVSSAPSSPKRAKRASASPSVDSTPTPATYTDEDWAKDVRWLVPPDSAAPDKKSRRFSAQPPIPEYVDLPLRPVERPSRRAKTMRAPRVRNDRMCALWEEEEPGEPSHSPERRLSRNNSIASNSTARSPLGRSSSRSQRRTATVDDGPIRPAPSPSSLSSQDDNSSGATASTATSGVIGGLGTGYTSLTLPRAGYKPADPWKTIGSGRIDLAKDGRAQVTMTSVEIVRGVAGGGLRGLLTRRASTARRGEKDRAGGDSKTNLAAELALTSHRSPPSYVPNSHVLVQVYAVALEGLDLRLAKEEGAGFVPGRAVVGRVVEAGVEVSGEEGKRGEWVVGLADVKKCGALAEFILLDRHRVHRVPQPTNSTQTLFSSRSSSPAPFMPVATLPRSRRSSASSSRSLGVPRGPSSAELALLPLGVATYRALRTWAPPPPTVLPTPPPILGYDEFPLAVSRKLLAAAAQVQGSPLSLSRSSTPSTPYVSSPLASHAHSTSSLQSTPQSQLESIKEEPPSALVLQGQSGAGAMGVLLLRALHPHVRVLAHVEPTALGLSPDAVHILPLQGWGALTDEIELDTRGADLLARLRQWGVDTACIGHAPAALEMLDCSVDFILDTVGGNAVWTAAARLLSRDRDRVRGESVFTTLVGDTARAVPGAQDHWRAARGAPRTKTGKRKVRWVWVPCSTDVDFEGLDVREGIGAVMKALGVGEAKGAWKELAEVVGEAEVFERAPELFGRRLEDGGCAVVKVAAT